MFSPKWKKDAKHLVKGAHKFIQYKRDLLEEDRIGEIESRREDLREAIKASDKDAVDEASKQLRATCENSLPREKPTNWFEENVEVMFVAIVIALGLRAYYLQPFRIPTGSMQPTLNGITGEPQAKDKWPSLPKRLAQKVLRGRTYVQLVADQNMALPISPTSDPDMPFITDLGDFQYLHFFSRSKLRTQSGEIIRLPAPSNPIYDVGLADTIATLAREQGVTHGVIQVPEGTLLCEGYVDTGDLVLVNKFAYHFRKPARGETFVFDTLGIKGIDEHTGPQGKGSHYIKRLCGVPGDTLEIKPPHLYINGTIAKEPGIERVMAGENGYQDHGYVPANPGDGKIYRYLTKRGDTLELNKDARPGMREYAALGDNTGSSLDSRYWGTVKEFNLVGPALFSLWPFTTGHWGFIE